MAASASRAPPAHATMSLATVGSKGKTQRIKLVSMGDSGVGKSCLIKRFCEGRFVSKYVMTIGVDFGVKPVRLPSGQAARVNFWDLSGRPEFLEVRNEFYRDSQAALLVFDVCRQESFEGLEGWLREAQRFGAPASMPLAVCGNKTDKGARRRVPAADARAWAAEHGLPYFETSAESGAGVAEAFEELLAAAGRAWASA
uniref:Uncharacterized protein n=3 Tax=Cafeteria roenbergensis TaxID=33653 RepID=A0A7S0K950_CAFRO|mmetsp:Transcript_9680/g.37680  ORF Transcript_9680/g.37680 Transcript_9680/m.37680 type:complete len:199 (+) Transcript_9680:67-663(+)